MHILRVAFLAAPSGARAIGAQDVSALLLATLTSVGTELAKLMF
jgi:hypothetical protein